MQSLLDVQEIIEPVARYMLTKHLKTQRPLWRLLQKTAAHRPIDLEKLQAAAVKDLTNWKESVVTEYKQKYRPLVKWLSDNVDRIPVPISDLINYSIRQPKKSITKVLAPQLSNSVTWVSLNSKIIHDDSILIKNILGHEHILAPRLQKDLPFWFIDSGYTNFLTKKKQWHRLVKNHIHQLIELGYFPADRLHLLPTLPQPWRKPGNKILVVESSHLHYTLCSTTLTKWRTQVRRELKKYTDRPIEFKQKNQDRKTRTSVYDLLQSTDEYYCVISDASSAAVEAIWCGIPVITLNTHVTNPVARSSIADIENLYRGPIGDWLCALTYSQYTYEEFQSGYALDMLRTYHGITI